MSTEVSAEFQDKELKDFLDKLNKNLNSIKKNRLKQVATRFGVVVFADIQKHFIDAKGPQGSWASWSDLYEERQKKLGKTFSNNVLRFSGRMRNTFKPSMYRQTGEGLLWYNNAKTKGGFGYAGHHDEFAKVTRPFMWLSRDAFDKISEITLDALLEENWS